MGIKYKTEDGQIINLGTNTGEILLLPDGTNLIVKNNKLTVSDHYTNSIINKIKLEYTDYKIYKKNVDNLKNKIPITVNENNSLVTERDLNKKVNLILENQSGVLVLNNATKKVFQTYSELNTCSDFLNSKTGENGYQVKDGDLAVVLKDESYNNKLTKYIYFLNAWTLFSFSENELSEDFINVLESGLTKEKLNDILDKQKDYALTTIEMRTVINNLPNTLSNYIKIEKQPKPGLITFYQDKEGILHEIILDVEKTGGSLVIRNDQGAIKASPGTKIDEVITFAQLQEQKQFLLNENKKLEKRLKEVETFIAQLQESGITGTSIIGVENVEDNANVIIDNIINGD